MVNCWKSNLNLNYRKFKTLIFPQIEDARNEGNQRYLNVNLPNMDAITITFRKPTQFLCRLIQSMFSLK